MIKGSYNSLSRFGVTIRNPNFIIQYKDEEFGTFENPTYIDLERAISMVDEVSWYYVNDHIKKKKPIVKIHNGKKAMYFKLLGDEKYEVVKKEYL